MGRLGVMLEEEEEEREDDGGGFLKQRERTRRLDEAVTRGFMIYSCGNCGRCMGLVCEC